MSELSQDKPNGHTGLPAPARGLARLCERRCYSIAESERCSDCPSLQPQARGLSAVEDVEAHKREGMFSDSAGRYYHNAVGVDLAFRHAEELGRLRKENAELRSEREGMVLVPQTEMQTIYERFKECHERLQKADGVRHSWADPYIAIAKERAK